MIKQDIGKDSVNSSYTPCGLAVVSTRVGGTADMIAEGVEGLLVAQRSREELASALIRLANEPTTRREMGLAARRQAEGRYDVLSVGRLLLERWGVVSGGPGEQTPAPVPDPTRAPGSASVESRASA